MLDVEKRLNEAQPSSPSSDAKGREPGTGNLGLWQIGEFMRRTAPEHQWLQDGILLSGGTSLLVAGPKTGKSTYSRNTIVRVATGGWLLGRECIQAPTLYCLFEGHWPTAQRHFQDMETPADAPIHVYYGPPPGEPIAWLEAAIEATGARFVVIDTLGRFLRVEDMNNYAEITKRTEPVIFLASNTGAHIQLLHHTRKSGGNRGEEASGSSALFASVDTGIFFKMDGDRRSIYTVQREGDDMEETALRLDSKGWNHLGTTAREEKRDELEADIADLLVDHKGEMRDTEIARRLKKRKQTVLAALNHMVKEGTVLRTGTGQPGDSFHFRAR